jgi:TetR/AcrR family transcriptional repressor of nem operon
MRPLTFNKHKALADVTLLFWLQGYGGTSVQQILTCMGLNRSSLYSTFGDKRALFIQALDQFSSLTSFACAPLNQLKEPKEAVRQFYNLVFFALPVEQRRNGCLLVNTILEQAGLDDELASIAASKLAVVSTAFQGCFESARLEGNLNTESDTQALASFFMTFTKGLRVEAREGRSEESMREMIEIALKILD